MLLKPGQVLEKLPVRDKIYWNESVVAYAQQGHRHVGFLLE
jgi:hypothetical protein